MEFEDYYSGSEDEFCHSDNQSDLDKEDDWVDDDSDGVEELEDDKRNMERYKVLKESDIKERQDDDITRVSSMLSLTRAASTLALCHYNWNVNIVSEKWFADEDKVRETVGLLPASSGKEIVELNIPNKSGVMKCRICLEVCQTSDMKSAGCGHLFCGECWKTYVRISIADGPGCLRLRCPDPSCRTAIDERMISMLASNEDNRKYIYYLRRSYVEASKDIKWCPAPGCEHAVIFQGTSDENYDVCCLCEYEFCWNCGEETHRPVNCETVKHWILKNSSEAENTKWILANSKQCPTCQRPIEKNHGCMHMVCSEPCGFHFCWLCLGSWELHNEETGGYYACNRYEKAKKDGLYDEEERIRNMAEKSLEKYTHYYERWHSNELSKQKALKDLHEMRTVNIDTVRQIHNKSPLCDAWEQIVECRRVLKWTYAYGYYLPDHDTAAIKGFFEFDQGEAERYLEKLHDYAEKELHKFLSPDGQSQEFNDIRIRILELTTATKTFFENLVRTLENELSDESQLEH